MDIVDEFYKALNRVGVLNFQDMRVSGEEGFLSRYVTGLNKPTIFDVGANTGKYARTVLATCPSAQVFVFEPHPKTFKMLTDTLSDPRLRAVNVGIGAADGSMELYDYRDEDGSSHASLYKDVIERIHHRPSVSHRVPVRRLDGLAAELGVSRIHLLKVDTEGHELAVFQGAEQLISSGAIDVIQFEFNEMNVISRTFFKDFWDLLSKYDFYRLLPSGALYINQYVPAFCEIFAFQNIVCVRKGMQIFG